jgi:PAS domain-containing protein
MLRHRLRREILENMNKCCQSILDVIPLMIFVVDNDVRIRDMNQAAATTFGLDKAIVFNKLGGEILHCLHLDDVPEGCGSGPSCESCLIRNTVTLCLQGQTITRRRARFVMLTQGSKKELELLITASPMNSCDEPLALLILEDISEFSMLKDIVPICMHCKNIRDDQDYWQTVESYFREFAGVDFSHGICPKCLKEHYPNVAQKLKM